uniref:Uncharacterized protein n=1 Tax=Scleropages formosus TaxID=113540 RepID=A0A8C9WMN8_SCLFO
MCSFCISCFSSFLESAFGCPGVPSLCFGEGHDQLRKRPLALPARRWCSGKLGFVLASWGNLKHLQGEVYGPDSASPAVQALLDAEPTVQCRENFMTLHLKGTLVGSNLLVDRGNGSPLPISELPSKCGYFVKMTWHDVLFKAPYNGCYNTKEGGSNVLPLRWLGTPMKVTCPHRPSTAPASVVCYPSGMVVKIDAPYAVASKINIKFKNKWKPLLWVSAQCGYSVVTHPGGLVITAPFSPCDETKAGMHTIEILEGNIKLSCPSPAANMPSNYFLFGKLEMPVPAPAAPWPPGFMYPQPPKPVPTTTAPEPTLAHPQPPKPLPATSGPWPPCFMYPELPKPLPATSGPWPPCFVYPQALKPVSASPAPKPTPAHPQLLKPVPTSAGPWPPCFRYHQLPKHRPATGGSWPPCFRYPQLPKSIPATAEPALAYPQPPKPVPATFAPPYLKPERGERLPSLNYPRPPWSVYSQVIPLSPGSQPFSRPDSPRPPSTHFSAYIWPLTYTKSFQAGYPHSPNCPFSHNRHSHLHLGSAREHHAPLPLPRKCNLPYRGSSSRPAIRFAAPAFAPQASHKAFKSYWDFVPPSHSE